MTWINCSFARPISGRVQFSNFALGSLALEFPFLKCKNFKGPTLWNEGWVDSTKLRNRPKIIGTKKGSKNIFYNIRFRKFSRRHWWNVLTITPPISIDKQKQPYKTSHLAMLSKLNVHFSAYSAFSKSNEHNYRKIKNKKKYVQAAQKPNHKDI